MPVYYALMYPDKYHRAPGAGVELGGGEMTPNF